MKAAIITIGDEILIGQVVNSNASYISSQLFSIGIPVNRIITVSDDEQDIIAEFKSAFKSFTKTCISKFFKSKLITDEGALRRIKKIFKRRKMPMPEVNYEQALIPDIAKVIPNPIGTAPGILVDKNNKVFCALPGVPYEMKKMITDSVLPYLRKKDKDLKKVIKHKNLHTIGISESLLYEKVGNINEIVGIKKGVSVKLAFLPSNYETRLRITVEAVCEKEADEAIHTAEKRL